MLFIKVRPMVLVVFGLLCVWSTLELVLVGQLPVIDGFVMYCTMSSLVMLAITAGIVLELPSSLTFEPQH